MFSRSRSVGLKRLALGCVLKPDSLGRFSRARIPEALPDGETDLGIVEEDERIITRERATPLGIRLEALKLKHDDPLIAGTEPGKVIPAKRSQKLGL